MPVYIRPETAQQRSARLGTAEDPGMDPDENKHFWRFGHSYHITRYERRWAAYDQPDPSFVRPLALVNFAMEIYQQNDKWLWVWALDPEAEDVTHAAAEAPPVSRFKPDHIAFFERIRPQFSPVTPPSSGKTLVFENSSIGLPTNGSWRSSLAVGDMNGDGFPDIILPSQRKGNGIPFIFLGDGKGHWRNWENIQWPHTVDYGGVAAADFNHDGHMDLVFAVHLNGVYVFLGDGKGNFTEVSKGLPRDFPTRRVLAMDVDGDGYPDIVTSSEGPTAMERADNADYGKIRFYLNRKKGTEWSGGNISAPPIRIGGDWLSAGNFNGDRTPDFVSSSVFQGSMEVIHLSDKPGHWKPLPSDGDLLPSISYFLANTTGKFSSKRVDDAIVSFIRYWPS
ncbi:MAG: VCBS repeat-containing protein, partial [Thermoanaerobaculia bacterium]